MPRRALRCVVDLRLRAVTAPGVWLPSRQDLYLSISMFGEYRTTNLCPSIFPVFVKEGFLFDKTYYTALDPSDVATYLEDELVIVELLQMNDCVEGCTRLASYCSSARDFLFPYPQLAPAYASNSRELLMSRTLDFPGIAPKLEFTTVTRISESLSPELDALDDACREERKGRRSRSRSRSRPSSRNSMRSPSPMFRKQLEEVGTVKRPGSAGIDTRPPFVVRHLDKSLIGRSPSGLGRSSGKKGKKTKRSRSLSRPRSALSDSEYYSDYSRYPDVSKYRSKKTLRDAGDDPLPVYESRYVPSEDEDAEVAALTSSVDNLYIPRRSRSPSPYLYRPSYTNRFLDDTLATSERIERKINESLRRSRELRRSLSPLPRLYSPYRYYYLGGSLDDLAVDTSIARSRRYY